MKKQAAEIDTGGMPPREYAARQEAKKLLVRNLLVAAGLGVGVRTSSGVSDWLFDGDDVEADNAGIKKEAGGLLTAALIAAIVAPVAGSAYLAHRAKKSFDVEEPYQVPWYLAANSIGVPAAFYGGHQLTDYLFDKATTGKLSKDVEQAEKEYGAALAKEHLATGPPAITKTSEAVDFVIDRIADSSLPIPGGSVKTAAWGAQAIAAVIALEAMIGGGSWILTKHYMDKADEARHQMEAMKAIQKSRQLQPTYSKGLTVEELFPGAAPKSKSTTTTAPPKDKVPTKLPRSL